MLLGIYLCFSVCISVSIYCWLGSILLNCDNRAYRIRETFDLQWSNSNNVAVLKYDGLSHSPRQGQLSVKA